MIAASASVLDRLQDARRKTHWRLLIEDADGAMRDYADQGGVDWRESAEWGKTVDQPQADGVVQLRREADGLSIAPMIEGSTLNRNGADAYAPAVDMGRRLEVWVQVTDPEAQPVETDWVLVHDAIIQKVEWGSSVVRLPTLDRSSRLGKIIRTDLRYGTQAGTPVEDVMQSLIDDVLGVGAFTLQVPVSPGFMVTEYPHGDATLVGKSVREALDDLTAAFAGYIDYRADLTLIVPDRTEPTAASAVAVIGPEHYKALPRLDVDLDGIRNVVRVTYRDASTGDVAFVEATHAGSISAYGESFIGITEGDESPIDTATEAQDMANDVRDDLAVQRVQQQVQDWFFYPVELGDHITWKANGKHYDSDQHWAVTGYRHHLSKDKRETTFDVRGAASGGYRRWLRRAGKGGVIEPPEEPAPPTSTPRVEQVSVNTYVNATDQAEGDVVVKVVDPDGTGGTLRIWSNPGTVGSPDPTTEAPDASIAVASGQTVGHTGSAANITTAVLTDILIAPLPYGVKRIFAEFETSDGRSSGPVLVPLVRTPDTGLPELPGDIDDVPDGTNYGKPRIGILNDGRVTRVRRTDGTDVTADAAVAANESITRLTDRTATNIAYSGGTTVEALKPGEAGAEKTTGKSFSVLIDRVMANVTDAGALATKDSVDMATGEVTNKTASNITYLTGTSVENLKPAEAGAQANPPSIEGADATVNDTGTDDVYTATWGVSDAVTASYTVRIRYYKNGALVHTKTGITATDLSDTHTQTGAGDSTSDDHNADLQLFDGTGKAVGGLVETLEHPSTI